MTDHERIALERCLAGELAELGLAWDAAESAARVLVAELDVRDARAVVGAYVDTALSVHRDAVIERLLRRIEQTRASATPDPRQAELFTGEAP